ncbi:MAG: hypothetical protein LC676_18230 [Loktanella sp.]|nr:hypothetical protein [Loktanella sp.]
MNEHDEEREHAIRAHNQETEFFRHTNNAAIEAGHIAVKSLFLINGGAVVVMLAFIANIFNDIERNAETLTKPLIFFVAGVGFAVLASALTYFTNYCFASGSHGRIRKWNYPYVEDTKATRRWVRWGIGFQISAIILAVASFVVFATGVHQLNVALSHVL